ncbi:Prephenate dehydrogenase [Candidatus Sulfotelmatobacter kueseliae]|uniref:Prephenate dehydrogenase n=1 Tax=Candidatus Sulfotelmatobacter kueseliae TaxID=2042962 RepID=A0A2U3KV76_9BACT|nr:Prephenate dehydrogenase [Candidatus Sulfotelmatobacter kueseliae]
MAIRQITIIGTGLIGGSLALALRKKKFAGRIVGCDREATLERARKRGAIDDGTSNPGDAIRGSQVVVLATPVLAIVDLIERVGPVLPARALLTDVGSTKVAVVERARKVFGKNAGKRFLAGHPMAGKELSGVDYADADLFQNAVWFLTPFPGQSLNEGLFAEYAGWIDQIGARIAMLPPEDHDRLCAWISHVPQMMSTALAAALVEEFGAEAPLLPAGGRALQEMTRIAASPYSMWRDIAISNQKNLENALWRVEQRLAHIRENLTTRELAVEFEQAHALRKVSLKKK